MPQLATLSKDQLQICDNTLRARGLIAPNKAILAAIIVQSPTLVRCLVRYYREKVTDGTLDTYERGYLLDAVADFYCKAGWPCNGDSMTYQETFADMLYEKASYSGWVFV